MKFNEMPYERPNLETVRAKVSALTDRLKSAADSAEAKDALLAADALHSKVNTAASLASVRHEINTTDPFYEKEVAFFDENLPLLEEVLQGFSKALLDSPHRPALEAEFGSVFFLNAEMDFRTFDPKIIPALQKENALATDYGKLLASAQISFQGEILTLSQLAPHKQSGNDSRRRDAWLAEAGFYMEHSDELDGIYDELVRVRDEAARTLGYDGFTQMGYDRMHRGSYGPAEVAEFRQAVVDHIVPLADRIMREQAKRIGATYPLNYPDAALQFRSGNPVPAGSADDILAHARRMYLEMSRETGQFIDLLYDQELLDVLSKKGKAGGGFCTSLPDYSVPFIFANFNGTAHDVEVMTHEAGHAFAYYLGRDIIPEENTQPTLEACEVHSMSMELLAWPWLDGFFGADSVKYRYTHLTGAITFLPYGALVDHFQHIIYQRPELTPAERSDVWLALLPQYMPWIDPGDLPFYGQGRTWQRQMHIYQCPFYYIDYCLAQTVALEVWTLSRQDYRAAWEKYLRYTRQAGTRDFAELLREADLASPFLTETLRAAADAVSQWLDSQS